MPGVVSVRSLWLNAGAVLHGVFSRLCFFTDVCLILVQLLG